MVFLKTDTGEYRELLVPSIVSVGRGTTNDIRPQNRSVSKEHAQITLAFVPGTSKVEAWLEDLNSSYGTYAGETPLEIERVKGKIKLYFGFYIRFGHAPSYFQYLETIPANAEVIRPEIVVSPTKEFQKRVQEFGQQQQPQQQPQRSQPSFQQQSSGGGMQPSSFSGPSTGPVAMTMTGNQGPPNSTNWFDGGSNLGASGIAEQKAYDQFRPQSSTAPTRSATPQHSDQHHAPYESNGEDDSQHSMRISVNYPTSSHRSPPHPVTIQIDPAGGTAPRTRPRSRESSRYGNEGGYSPTHGGGYVDDEYGRDASLDFAARAGQSRSLLNASGTRVSWQDEVTVGAHGTHDRVAFADSFDPEELDSPPRSQSYTRNNVIRSQHRSILDGHYDNVSGSLPGGGGAPASSSALALSNSSSKPKGKPKSVYENISELNALARRSVGQQSNKVGRSSGAEDQAMHSRYYQDSQRHLRHSSDPLASSGAQPKGILKPTRQADFQTKAGSSTAILDAIAPTEAVLVRRSWPEELFAPSSELIAGFVDLLLAQEPGTTEKEFSLYKEIYLGKAKDKNTKNPLPVGPDGQTPDLSAVPILAFLKMNPVKCELPVVLPDAVLSEAVAESILDTASTATGLMGKTIQDLNNLLRQCLLGSHIDGTVQETSVDFDHALQGVITSILKQAITQLMSAQQSNVIAALESGKNKTGLDVRSNVGLLIQQSIDSLSRLNGFMTGTYLQEETAMLRTHHVYEIAALALSGILNKLDACNVTVWSIGQRADEVAMEHVVNKSAGFLKASLSLELEELRKLKKESDLTPLVDRIRQQEANILERKILRFHKVFDIILHFNLRSAFWEWRTTARALKRQEMQLLDLTERCAATTKRQFFKAWLQNYRKTHASKKTLRRFGRIIGWKGCTQLRKYMHRWRSMVDRSKQYNESGVEIARLRSEVCNLKAVLHDLTNKEEVAASLAAERSLNRELASVNQELRLAMQQQQEKLLEIGGAPSSKRKDLVYHYLLGKEEELAEARREIKFLHSELEHLRILAVRRLQPVPKGRTLPPAPVAKPGHGGYKQVSLLRDDGPLNQPVGGRVGQILGAVGDGRPSAVPAVSGGSGSLLRGPAPPASQTRYDPSRNRTVADKPNNVAFMMSKEEARAVILSEVRRLRDSHAALQESRNALNNKMIEETNRNVQLTMATQSLQSRLTAMERSANALRQILRQKFGDQGVLHMMEALEKLGAGSNALLEVPSSGTAEVVAADVVERAPYSYEAKHPDHPPSAAPTVSPAIPSSSYYLQALPAGYSGGARTGGGAASNAAGKGYQSPYAGASGGVDGPEGAMPENPYARAIEGAMYGKR